MVWEFVYANDDAGAPREGSRSDLVAAIEGGAEVRIFVDYAPLPGCYKEAQAIWVRDGHVYAQNTTSVGCAFTSEYSWGTASTSSPSFGEGGLRFLDDAYHYFEDPLDAWGCRRGALERGRAPTPRTESGSVSHALVRPALTGPIVETRIRDDSLAERWAAGQGPWSRVSRPVLHRVGDRVSTLDLSGRRIACFGHIAADSPLVLLPLVRAGAQVSIAAVNPDSTDDAAAAQLARHGVAVWAWSGMSAAERDEGLARLAAEPADAVSDMGGELVLATALRGDDPPRAALEATTTGIHLLAGVDLPFPVFDWNGIPLKDRIHNRHHVGIQAWPAISDITGLAPYGRTVLVVGFGPVGRGVAIHARTLGAIVSVAEVDPVKCLEALHHGLRVVPLDEGLRTCSIIVTATGRQGVIGPDQLLRTRSGAILANVGHSNREIDVDWLDTHPRLAVRRHIDRYSLEDGELFLLNRGSLVNLAAGAGLAVDELFDPFAAIILLGLAWILEGGADGARPGLQPYPASLEREVAELSLAARA